MRALLALPFLAACVHTPPPCEWPRTCEERRDAADMPVKADASPPASKPVDDSNGAETGDKTTDNNADRPRKHHSRDGNGDSSDKNGGKSND